ncbi:TRAP transporter small permease [Actinomadura miaoliensis]|uniref:Tripartite ATP-independent periplasmic transporters DctQ component domain-containing protein n=1 Tax=Actinomadura miaoliensis TaxID=430685 RepID=A0ABP7V1T5_9ACTN
MSAPSHPATDGPPAGDRAPDDSSRTFRLDVAVIEVAAVAVTFVMMLHITANALLRSFADRPMPNTLEIVQYWYLPIVAFLGFVAAQHRGQHIAADLLFERLPEAARRPVLAVVLAACCALAAGFAWFGWQEALHAYEIRKTAGVSDLPAWPTYFLVPLAFAGLTAQFAAAAVRAAVRPVAEHAAADPDEAAVLRELSAAENKEARS